MGSAHRLQCGSCTYIFMCFYVFFCNLLCLCYVVLLLRFFTHPIPHTAACFSAESRLYPLFSSHVACRLFSVRKVDLEYGRSHSICSLYLFVVCITSIRHPPPR